MIARGDVCTGRLSAPHRIAHLAVPLVRAYVRRAPSWLGRRAVWRRLGEPYFAWHSHDFRARLRYGGRLAGNQSDLLPKCAYWFGVWEPVLSRYVSDALEPGDGFLDVGANVGYFSVMAAHRVGARGFVVSLEPSPPLVEELRFNVALNRLTNVRVVPVAAGADEGSVEFFDAGCPNRAESTTVPSAGFEFAGRVPQRPLGAVLTEDELRGVRLVKIDVEGAELGVLEGLRPRLQLLRQDAELIVELHPKLLVRQGRHVGEVAELLAADGFQPYGLPLDFSDRPLLDPPARVRPERLRKMPEQPADVIFSRRDTDRF